MQPQLPPHVAKNIDGFTGRTWLLPTLLEWWDQSEERLFLLTGGPGTGKSMIMAWLAGFGPEPADATARAQLARLREQVKAAHFCQADSRNISPQAFAESIANQLSAGTPGFAHALKATLADLAQFNVHIVQNTGTVAAGGTMAGLIVDLGALGDERSFDRALVRPLKQLYGTGHAEPMLLLVDALDEAQTYGGGTIKTLSKLLGRIADLPTAVRILATSRDDPRVLKSFRDIEPFDLIKDAPADVDDVRSYSEARLSALAAADGAKSRDFAARLAEQAGGVFLYAAMVLDELLKRPPAEWPDLATYSLPDGLNGLYHNFLERELGEDEDLWFDVYEPLLGMIAVAQGQGLTARQLSDVVGKDIRKALRASKQYLSGELPEGPFRPFHKSFADFLLEEEDNIDFHIDATAMHRRIAERFWAEHRKRSRAEGQQPPDSPSGADCQAQNDQDDGYVVDWLPYHLAKAGLVEQLRGLQFDLPWLRRKLIARDTDALINDTQLCAGDAEIVRLGRALRLSANVLKRDRRQLEAQLLGRLLREDGPRIAELLDGAAREIPAGVLVPRGGWDLRSSASLLQTLEGHNQFVNGALLLPDARALSWSQDNTLRLWDLETGNSRVLEGHGGPVLGALLLSEGRALSWSYDGTLRVWDLETGEGRALVGHGGAVAGALLLPDGRILSWSDDATLRVWDLETFQNRIFWGHRIWVWGARLLADGRALSWSDDCTLRVWDLQTGQSRVLKGNPVVVRGALLLPDGRVLSWGGETRLWDLQTGQSQALKELVLGALLLPDGRVLSWSGTLQLLDLKTGASRLLKGHSRQIYGVMLLPDGRALSWSEDCTLRVWDLQTGESRSLEGHGKYVTGALLLPDGRALSWSGDHTLRLWDLETGESSSLEGHSSPVVGALLLPDGHALSWSFDGTLRLWNLDRKEGHAHRDLEGHDDHVLGALLVPRGRVVSWSKNCTLRLWDLETRKNWPLHGHRLGVAGTLLLPDGRVLSWSEDCTLRLWDLETQKHRLLREYQYVVKGALLLPDGRLLSWSGRTLHLWDRDVSETRALEGHRASVIGALPLPNGLTLSWSHDNTLRLWDLETGKSRTYEDYDHRDPLDVLLIPGGYALSLNDGPSNILLWDLKTGKNVALQRWMRVQGALLLPELRVLSWSGNILALWDLNTGKRTPLIGHTELVKGALLLSDNSVLSWSADGTLRVWDLKTRDSHTLDGHRRSVNGARLLPDGRALSWSDDRTMRLWNLDSLEETAQAAGDDIFTACAVDESGRLAVVGDSRGRVLLFDLPD